MAVTLARWTLADYHDMVEAGLFAGRPIELLNGLIVEMPPEGPDHADSSTRLMPHLWGAAQERYQVRADKPISIPLSESEPEPDIALVRDRSYRNAHPQPDDIFLVIEFSKSSLEKDTEEKRFVYTQAGIADYWVVNLRDRSTENRQRVITSGPRPSMPERYRRWPFPMSRSTSIAYWTSYKLVGKAR